MVDINKNTNCLAINVSSGSNKQNSTQADCDAISYYSELSRQWAVKLDGTVDGNENSAKYYAQLANSFAIDAEQAKDSVLDDTGFIAISADLTGANNIRTCADNISCIQDAASNAQIAEAKAIIAAEQAALAQESATEVNNVLANSANTDFSNITDNAKTVIKENGGVWGFIQGDISEQTDLSETFETKADVDLSNCTKPYITETYCSGASWYRIWSDGWIEQGGQVGVINGSAGTQITLIKNYSDANYCLQVTNVATSVTWAQMVDAHMISKTNSGFKVVANLHNNSANWYTCGY